MRRIHDLSQTEKMLIRRELTELMVKHDLSLEAMSEAMADTICYYLQKLEGDK